MVNALGWIRHGSGDIRKTARSRVMSPPPTEARDVFPVFSYSRAAEVAALAGSNTVTPVWMVRVRGYRLPARHQTVGPGVNRPSRPNKSGKSNHQTPKGENCLPPTRFMGEWLICHHAYTQAEDRKKHENIRVEHCELNPTVRAVVGGPQVCALPGQPPPDAFSTSWAFRKDELCCLGEELHDSTSLLIS